MTKKLMIATAAAALMSSAAGAQLVGGTVGGGVGGGVDGKTKINN